MLDGIRVLSLHGLRSDVFIGNFEQIQHNIQEITLVFLHIASSKCFLLGNPFGKSFTLDTPFTDIQVSYKKCSLIFYD